MDIIDKIRKLKMKKNAIILAHYYQSDEVQQIADFVGDSLELSKVARDTDKDMIVFCGVDFMAGSAKLLSPHKTILLPVKDATCPMANMITSSDIIGLRKLYPDAAVVTYINSTVDVKTVTDICCTSSNAINVVNSLDNDEIIFVPDKNLGAYVSKNTDKKVILWGGYCCVHNDITLDKVQAIKDRYPNAELVVHPECRSEVIDIADFCGSTSKIIEYIDNSPKKEFIVGTEEGIIYKLKCNNPDKIFYTIDDNVICSNMKKITLLSVYQCLLNEEHKVELDEDTINLAEKPLIRMMNL